MIFPMAESKNNENIVPAVNAPPVNESTVNTPSVNASPASGLSGSSVVSGSAANGPVKKKSVIPFLIIGCLLFLLFGIIIFIVIILINSQKTTGNDGLNVSPTPTTSIEVSIEPSGEEEPLIKILEPDNKDYVNGSFVVKGTADASLKNLTIKVYDGNDKLIGSGGTELTGTGVVDWAYQLNVSVSPETPGGAVKVFPSDEEEDGTNTVMVNVDFKNTEAIGRIKVTAPLTQQVIPVSGGKILIMGKMKDFFEGTLSVKLVGGNGGTLYKGTITADGDNYDQWADFKQEITIDPIPSTSGSPLKLEFYDTSMKDGSKKTLVTVIVRVEN